MSEPTLDAKRDYEAALMREYLTDSNIEAVMEKADIQDWDATSDILAAAIILGWRPMK